MQTFNPNKKDKQSNNKTKQKTNKNRKSWSTFKECQRNVINVYGKLWKQKVVIYVLITFVVFQKMPLNFETFESKKNPFLFIDKI